MHGLSCHPAFGSLVPQPGTELRSPALEKDSNHWTTRAVPWQLLTSLKLFLNEKFKDSLSDVVWDLHVFELELQSPDFPSLLMSQSV